MRNGKRETRNGKCKYECTSRYRIKATKRETGNEKRETGNEKRETGNAKCECTSRPPYLWNVVLLYNIAHLFYRNASVVMTCTISCSAPNFPWLLQGSSLVMTCIYYQLLSPQLPMVTTRELPCYDMYIYYQLLSPQLPVVTTREHTCYDMYLLSVAQPPTSCGYYKGASLL